MDSYAGLLNVATDIADEAGENMRRLFGQKLTVSWKPVDGTIVTELDMLNAKLVQTVAKRAGWSTYGEEGVRDKLLQTCRPTV